MKYGNSQNKTAHYGLVAGLLLGLLSLGGCVTTSKTENTAGQQVLALRATEQFLPVETYDKEGTKLPYQAVENPYQVQKGRIKKEYVASYIEARRAFKAGELSKAADILKPLTEASEKLSGPWVMLGDISVQQQSLSQAVEQYQQALQINPENVNAYLRLAKVKRLQGNFLEAQNLYADALSVWRDFPEAHLNLAVLYDVYMNRPLLAQQHMEAYQFLAGTKNDDVSQWLAEIRSRTGIDYSIGAGASQAEKVTAPVSVAGG